MKNIFSKSFCNRISCIITGLILCAFPSFSQDFSEEKPVPEDAIVFMERTQCYGTCPVYSFYVFEDGTAQYQGKENVEKTGSYVAEVDSGKVAELVSLFYEYAFFDFDDRYVDLISDLPTTYIYFSHKGRSKKIVDYHGAPESLKKLEKDVDKFIKSIDWKKVED